MEANGEQKIVASSDHNHRPDVLKVAALKHRTALKRRAGESSEPPDKVMRLCAAESPLEVCKFNPNLKNDAGLLVTKIHPLSYPFIRLFILTQIIDS